MKYIDAHVDTITKVFAEKSGISSHEGHLCLDKLKDFDAAAIFFAIYFNKEETVGLFDRFLEVYDFLVQQVEKNSARMSLALNAGDIKRHLDEGRISAVPAIEEGAILEGSMDNFHRAAALGVRSITLTHNFPNEIGEPSIINGGGLTRFGFDLLREMREMKVLADVSHLSEAGFWDVYKFGTPFIASHSNCKALCGHHRNLTDNQLKAVGDIGGCVGLNVSQYFLSDDANADIYGYCRHIDHALKFAGEDSVGIGTDFDGISRPALWLGDAAELSEYLYNLLYIWYGKELTDKIFYKNFLRTIVKEVTE